MTDYAWFPVSGNGETPQTAYTWNAGTYAFTTGSYWADVDADPPYPISTGAVPGAGAGGSAQDNIYLFAGAGSASLINDFYTPDPADGDPYLATAPDGNYELPTNVLLNTGSVEIGNLSMDAINAEAGPFYPVLDIQAATLHVTGSLIDTINAADYPAGLGAVLAEAEEYAGLAALFGIQVNFTLGGTIEIGGGGRLDVGGSIQAGFDLDFTGGGGNTLQLDGVTTAAAVGGTIAVGGTVTNFAAGDTIDLPNIPSGSVNSISYNPATGVLDVNVGDPTDILIDVLGTGLSSGSFTPASDAGGGLELVMCYAAGTRIATPRGELPVEALAVGEMVLTVLSGPRPIRWIGRRRVDLARHPAPGRVGPVRIAAGAFGAGLPRRDLLLSPDHAVYVDGALIPVRALVNGISVAPAACDAVTYYHIELERHDVLLAEGLPAESYLETGGRDRFENGGAAIRLHPDFASRAFASGDLASRTWEAEGCAPLLLCGPVVDRVRARLAAPPRQAAA